MLRIGILFFLVLAGCEPPRRFSGVLEVEVIGPPEAKIGLFNHPSAGVQEQPVTLDARRDRCAVESPFFSGATTPRQVFEVVAGPFEIALDPALPAAPLSLAAWIDVDEDAELDYALDPVEPCAAAVKELERGPIAIVQIDPLDDGSFRVIAEDGSVVDDEVSGGWVFSL